jgi:hypothetical protein
LPVPPKRAPVQDGVAGRLEIKLLGPAVDGAEVATEKSEAPDDLGGLGSKRISVVAENATVGDIAGALAEVLGANVFVEPAAARNRTFMHAGNTTVRQIVDAISEQADVVVTRCRSRDRECADEEAGLHFVTYETDYGRRAAFADDAPLKLRLVRLPEAIDPLEFAGAYCALIASPDGEAAVVGRTVILKDTLDGLSRGELFAKNLQGSLLDASPVDLAAE